LRTGDWSRVFSLEFSFTGAFLTWSSGGWYIAGSTHGEYVCVWSAGDGAWHKSWGFKMFEIYALALSPDARFVAVSLGYRGEFSGKFVVLETSGGSEVYKQSVDCVIHDVAWSPDGRYFIYIDDCDNVDIVDVLSRKAVWGEHYEDLSFRNVAWSPDGRYILGWDVKSIYVLEAFTGRLLRSFRFDDVYMGGSPFSPDGRYIVLSPGKGVSILDVLSGELVMDLRDVPGDMLHLAWSPCGRFIAGLRDGVVHVWDASSGDLLTTFSVPRRDFVIGLAWLYGSSRIVTAGENGFVRVWDLDSGSEVAVFRVRHALSALSVSRDDVLAVGCKSCDVILLYPRDVL